MSGGDEPSQESVASEDHQSSVNGEAFGGDGALPKVAKSKEGSVDSSEKPTEKPIANGKGPAPTPEEVEEAELAIKREAADQVTSKAPAPYYTPFSVLTGVTLIVGSITAVVYQATKKPKKKDGELEG